MRDIFTPGLDLILANAPVKIGLRMNKYYPHCSSLSEERKLIGGWSKCMNVPMCPSGEKRFLAEEFAVSETETRKTESGENNSQRCEERGRKSRPTVSAAPRASQRKKPVPPEITLAESGASRSHERNGRKTEGGGWLDAIHSTKMEAPASDIRDWLSYFVQNEKATGLAVWIKVLQNFGRRQEEQWKQKKKKWTRREWGQMRKKKKEPRCVSDCSKIKLPRNYIKNKRRAAY